MDIEKRKFILKAMLAGVLGVFLGTFNNNDPQSYIGTESVTINIPIWITILVLLDYFRITVLFWVAFEHQIQVRGWVVAGFIGSLIYALSVWLFRGFISPQPILLVNMIVQVFFGGISSIPIWLILNRYYSRAYLWAIANATGYSLIGSFAMIRDSVMLTEAINRIASASFLTIQLVSNGLQCVAYALFGLLLGICLYEILQTSRPTRLHVTNAA